LLALIPAAGIAGARLCVDSFPRGTQHAAFDLPDDNRFSLSFIHSVSITPVTDHYSVEGDAILQTSEVFMAHGAGLPSFSGDVGATGWHHENGEFTFEMHRPIGTMIVRVQAEYQNILHIGSRKIRLADWGDGALRLSVCRQTGETG
jgi:hypothetical protein